MPRSAAAQVERVSTARGSAHPDVAARWGHMSAAHPTGGRPTSCFRPRNGRRPRPAVPAPPARRSTRGTCLLGHPAKRQASCLGYRRPLPTASGRYRRRGLGNGPDGTLPPQSTPSSTCRSSATGSEATPHRGAAIQIGPWPRRLASFAATLTNTGCDRVWVGISPDDPVPVDEAGDGRRILLDRRRANAIRVRTPFPICRRATTGCLRPA